MLFEKNIKFVFEVRKNTQNGAKCPLQLYKPVCLQNRVSLCIFMLAWSKQSFPLYFDAGLEHMATRQCGNESYVDWLRLSCDISPCDLSPKRNPETYGRPVKSAIVLV